MKNFLLLPLVIMNFTTLALFAHTPKYFSFQDYNQVFDYRNGMNLERIDTYRNIKNKIFVKKVAITVIDEDEHQYYEYHYENGLLKTDISHVHDLSVDGKLYDINNRIIKSGEDFEYKYISDYCREYIYKGKIKSREEIFEDNSFSKITRNNYSVSLKTGEIVPVGKDEEEFYYDSDKLIQYTENSWNIHGIKSNFTKKVSFYYDDNNYLRKIISGYNEDDIREIKFLSYDERGNMSELTVYDVNEKLKYKVIFSDYDNYENWHKSQTFYNDGTTETVIREFFYR